jgi:protein TonB
VAAVDQCQTEALRRWGISTEALSTLRSFPRPSQNVASLVGPNDYPASALRGGRDGTVIMRMTVGVDGRVSDCATVVSSGHQDLDRGTCEVAQRRFRFIPAVGRDGVAVAAPLVTSVTWTIP